MSAVGAETEVTALAGPGTTGVDVGDRVVMPGLGDVHNHHFVAGRSDCGK